MNLIQIENKIKDLRENWSKASNKLSAIVNNQNYRIALIDARDPSKMINIGSLFDEATWKILEQRARNEYQAADQAITDFEKKFA